MSKCDRLPRHHAIEDVWLALDMLPRFRWRWDRKDVKGEHPLIAALAERVMEVPLANMTGPPGQSMLLPEVEWEHEEESGSNGNSGNGTPTFGNTSTRYSHISQQRPLPQYQASGGPSTLPPQQQRKGDSGESLADFPPGVFYPFYPEADEQGGGAHTNSAQVLAMLAAQHDGYGVSGSAPPQQYMEEEWSPSVQQQHHHHQQALHHTPHNVSILFLVLSGVLLTNSILRV